MKPIAALISFLTVSFGAASAQTLLSEDFQSGELGSWRGSPGRGDIQLTEYAGNISMRLTRDAWAGITVPLPSGEAFDADVSVSFAAMELEGKDACVLEFSAGGQDWQEIGRIADGEDDGLTLYNISSSLSDVSAPLAIRVRAAANGANDTCWADNVRVVRKRNVASLPDDLSAPGALQRLDDASLLPAATTAFRRPENALDPEARIEGSFRLSLGQTSGSSFIVDRFGYAAGAESVLNDLPELSFDLIMDGDTVLPLETGLVASGHRFWDYIVTPGKAWNLPDEEGWTRIALPFALVERNANCVHNGLLTFAVHTDGSATSAFWQIGSETCAYFQFDAWGAADVAFTPSDLAGRETALANQAQDIQTRLPIRPIADLTTAYPGIDIDAFGSPEDISPAAMTLFGLVTDGTHYVGGCKTRFGPYPYCDEMVLPTYSFAKSMIAGLALMRLEQIHPGAMQARIADYVPGCGAQSWRDVTFENALDMATGHYLSPEPDADENAAIDQNFFLSETHAEKVAIACSQYPHREEPGRTFVYHTSDTYLLGTAIQAFWRAKAGPDADFYNDLLVEPVFKPLGLSSTIRTTRRTYDETRQPFSGWGGFMRRGDLARLLAFIGAGDGQINGEQILAPAPLAAALRSGGEERGLPAPAAPLGYDNGFWSYDIQAFGGCDAPTPIPFMSGFGGLVGAFLPNGVAYYYISDGGDYRWARAALATEAIAPFCNGGK